MNRNEYSPNMENQEDHLRLIFAHYFTFMKYHKDKFTPEHINDAINSALYGLDFGFNRTEYLHKLVGGLDEITKVANHALQQRELDKHYWNGEYKQEVEKTVKQEVMTLDDVIMEFGLARNSVKDKKWRDKHDFPYKQMTANSSVIYYRSEIQKWAEERMTPKK